MKPIHAPTFLSSYGPFVFAWILANSIPKGFIQLPFWDGLLMRFAIYTMIGGLYTGISWILVRDRPAKVQILEYFIEGLILLVAIEFLVWIVSGKPLWLVIPISVVGALISVACVIAGGVYVARKCG